MGKYEDFRESLRKQGHKLNDAADIDQGKGKAKEVRDELNRPVPGSAEARALQSASGQHGNAPRLRDTKPPKNGDLIPRQGGAPARHNGQPDPSQGQGTNGTRIFRQNASGGVGPEITRKPR